MALVAGDERIVKAHMEAVMEVMAKVEKDATTRVYDSGMRVPVKTSNIAAALMTHTTSRAGDPNLHTHSNIINMTQRPDGHWGA
ncbi:relaxase domain-containing protein [Aeromonas hydrophila]|uniref:Relaxase domain-containing protein n=1 Tax=Aeromonas hydrophila TaxID=644 RepID=A0A926IYG3_AERHY|nr:relaxase domain-containing protein [Aeromonas hydrophila]